MSGAPGSGKSTTANLLAKAIDAIIIDHDLIKSFFLENGVGFGQSAKLTYGLDRVLAEDFIKREKNVIIDSTCNYDEVVEFGTELARRYEYGYKYVECRVDDIDLLDERLKARESLLSQRRGVNLPPPDADGSRTDGEYCELFRKWIENPSRPTNSGDVIIVDSTLPPQKCVDYILNRIFSE
ncbi:hypothetical protein ABW20_dc0103991 [Dactylellina cionopaga]|nr:hypothetical protein ABW20_dc0103991 [Dactylellina cionopaga]